VLVGRNRPLVDRRCHLDLGVGIDGEQCLEPVLLVVGEEICAGAQGRPRVVERIVFAAPAPRDRPLDTAPALIQTIASKANDVEGGPSPRPRQGSFGGSGREAGEPIHRDHLHPVVAPRPGSFGRPGRERLLGTPLDHVRQSCWAGAIVDRGEVDDHRDVLVTAPGASPHVLVHADRGDAVEPVGVIDQHPFPLGRDRVIGRMPRDSEALGGTGHGRVLVHDAFQCPPQPTSRRLGPRLGRTAGVLTPYVLAAGAPVTAQGRLQHARPS